MKKTWRHELFPMSTYEECTPKDTRLKKVVSINMLPDDILMIIIESLFTDNSNLHKILRKILRKVSRLFKFYVDKITKRSIFEKVSIFYKNNYHIFITVDCESDDFIKLYNKYEETKTKLKKVYPIRNTYNNNKEYLNKKVEDALEKIEDAKKEVEYSIQKKYPNKYYEYYIDACYANLDNAIKKYHDAKYALEEFNKKECANELLFEQLDSRFMTLEFEMSYAIERIKTNLNSDCKYCIYNQIQIGANILFLNNWFKNLDICKNPNEYLLVKQLKHDWL